MVLRTLLKSKLMQKQFERIQKRMFIKGFLIRTKPNLIEKGEKPTKYVLSLEKRNNVNKTVGKLMHSNCTVITSQENILAEIERL